LSIVFELDDQSAHCAGAAGGEHRPDLGIYSEAFSRVIVD
jgi:hypothetical protein